MAIGNSLFDEEGAKIVDNLYTKAAEKNVQIHLPTGLFSINKMAQLSMLFEDDGVKEIGEHFLSLSY